MFSVIRDIHFSYGHRLLNHPGKCARLHGHNGVARITVSSETLDEQGMVMDFYQIREAIQTWIDQTLDHRMILWQKDPLVVTLQKHKEDVLTMEVTPTAENLAKWIFETARQKGLPVTKVELWETADSGASYEG